MIHSGQSFYYPAFLNIRERRCVVIGGGEVALRKVRGLLECGAQVTVISPAFHPTLVELAEGGRITPVYREFEPGDLNRALIAIAATDVREVNQKVAEEARDRGVLVNVVDSSEQSDFIIPSSFRRGGLSVAISTGGMSPALARKIRMKLEEILGEEFAPLLSMIEDVRSTLKLKGMVANADAWEKALDLDLLIGLVQTGQLEEARAALLSELGAQGGGKGGVKRTGSSPQKR
jgi:precorrin-2 dehydrogenase/sirohydrochlorin ferrochelatase